MSVPCQSSSLQVSAAWLINACVFQALELLIVLPWANAIPEAAVMCCQPEMCAALGV